MNGLQGQRGNRHAQHGDQGNSPRAYREGSPGSVLLAVVQGELVQQVLCQAGFRSAHLAQRDHVVPQLFDEHHLLLQVVTLQEMAQVAVSPHGGQQVQVQQVLVHVLRQVQGAVHGPQAAVPFIPGRTADVPQTDSAPAQVLQPHQPLRVLLLLVGPLQEELAEVLQGHVFTVEVEGHGRVHVAGVEVDADVGVDGGLTLRVVVLAHKRRLGQHLHVFRHRHRAPRLWRRRSRGCRVGCGKEGCGDCAALECPAVTRHRRDHVSALRRCGWL